MRKRLIIVGAGGLGRIVYDVLINDVELRDEVDLAGFLDTRTHLVLPPELDCPILGSPLDHPVQPDEVFIPAVGNPKWRKNLVGPLATQGAEFFIYARRAAVAARARIGRGSFLTPGAVISTDCQIGDFSYLDTYTILGHDVRIGKYCMVGAMSFLAGGVQIGDGVTINPHATIAKGVQIGDDATIGIGSVIVKNVPAGVTMFGNPARAIY